MEAMLPWYSESMWHSVSFRKDQDLQAIFKQNTSMVFWVYNGIQDGFDLKMVYAKRRKVSTVLGVIKFT